MSKFHKNKYYHPPSLGIANNVTEVIKFTGFDAYTSHAPAFEQALKFMDEHPGWVQKNNSGKDSEVDKFAPPNLQKLRNAVVPIYRSKKGITGANYYFSPKAEDYDYKHKGSKRNAEMVRKEHKKDGHHLVKVEGLLPTDDFEFYYGNPT